MARTKSDWRKKSTGAKPRKQLATKAARKPACKRKACDIDDDSEIGNDRKKIKLDINHNLNNQKDSSLSTSQKQETDSSSSESESESEDDDASTISKLKSEYFNNNSKILPTKMANIISSIQTTFKSNDYSENNLFQFAKELEVVTAVNHNQLKELEYRKKSVGNFMERFKVLSARFRHSFGDLLNDLQNKQMYAFAKSMIKGFRYKYEITEDEQSYSNSYVSHNQTYSVDIALKTSKYYIDNQYFNEMHQLLGVYLSQSKNLSKIIIEYTNNRYKWYRIILGEESSDGEIMQSWQEQCACNNGIIFNVPFDIDDYFRDNTFYKERKGGSQSVYNYSFAKGEVVNFSQWRKELRRKCIKKMTDEMLAKFIIAVIMIVFSYDDVEGEEEWIIDKHSQKPVHKEKPL